MDFSLSLSNVLRSKQGRGAKNERKRGVEGRTEAAIEEEEQQQQAEVVSGQSSLGSQQ